MNLEQIEKQIEVLNKELKEKVLKAKLLSLKKNLKQKERQQEQFKRKHKAREHVKRKVQELARLQDEDEGAPSSRTPSRVTFQQQSSAEEQDSTSTKPHSQTPKPKHPENTCSTARASPKLPDHSTPRPSPATTNDSSLASDVIESSFDRRVRQARRRESDHRRPQRTHTPPPTELKYEPETFASPQPDREDMLEILTLDNRDSQMPEDDSNIAFIADASMDLGQSQDFVLDDVADVNDNNNNNMINSNQEVEGNEHDELAHSSKSDSLESPHTAKQKDLFSELLPPFEPQVIEKFSEETPKSGTLRRRRSEASILDFSFLDEDSDMYSQIKGRSRRANKRHSLDSLDLMFSQTDYQDKKGTEVDSQEETTALPLPKVIQGLSQTVEDDELVAEQSCGKTTTVPQDTFSQLETDSNSPSLISRSKKKKVLCDSPNTNISTDINISAKTNVPANTNVSTNTNVVNIKPVLRQRTPSLRCRKRSLTKASSRSHSCPPLTPIETLTRLLGPLSLEQTAEFSLPLDEFNALLQKKLKLVKKSSASCPPDVNGGESSIRERSGQDHSASGPENHVTKPTKPVEESVVQKTLANSCPDNSESQQSSLSFSDQDETLQYMSSIKLPLEEPVQTLTCAVYAPDRTGGTPQLYVAVCTVLRVLVWVRRGRGWRLVREWSLGHIQAECITGVLLPSHTRGVLIASSRPGQLQLSVGSLDYGVTDISSVWTSKLVCSTSCKQTCHLVNDSDVIMSAADTSKSHLYHLPHPTAGGDQTEVRLTPVQDLVVSVCGVDGLRSALLGASRSRLYVWNLETGDLVKTLDVGLSLSGCPLASHEEGLLFVTVLTSDPGHQPGGVVVCSPVSGHWEILHQLSTSSIPGDDSNKSSTESGPLSSWSGASDVLCGCTDGRCVLWSVYTGEVLAYSVQQPSRGPVLVHKSCVLITDSTNSLIHVYRLSVPQF